MPENTDKLNLPPELAQIEGAFSSLNPAATGISRDRLLFEAGRADASRMFWLWRGAAVGFAGLSLVLAVLVVFPIDRHPTIVERERIVEVRVPVPALPEPPRPSSAPVSDPVRETVQKEPALSPEAVHMFQIRRDVMRWGPDVLPESRPVEKLSSDESARELGRWLELPPGVLTAPYQKARRQISDPLGND